MIINKSKSICYCNLGHILLIIVPSDTAGLRKAINPIEEEGIRRAVQRYSIPLVWLIIVSCVVGV